MENGLLPRAVALRREFKDCPASPVVATVEYASFFRCAVQVAGRVEGESAAGAAPYIFQNFFLVGCEQR